MYTWPLLGGRHRLHAHGLLHRRLLVLVRVRVRVRVRVGVGVGVRVKGWL